MAYYTALLAGQEGVKSATQSTSGKITQTPAPSSNTVTIVPGQQPTSTPAPSTQAANTTLSASNLQSTQAAPSNALSLEIGSGTSDPLSAQPPGDSVAGITAAQQAVMPAVPLTTTSSALSPSQPAAAQSASSTASTGSSSSAATPSTLDDLASIIAALNTGGNVGAADSGDGIGSDDTSLPSPTAADVAALQPTVAGTTSTGPSGWIVVGIVVALGIGGYFLWRHLHHTHTTGGET